MEDIRLELAVQTLQSFGTVRLKVTGISMLPSLWPGDLLTIRSQSFEQASPGDIILYRRDQRMFIHRVIRKNGDILIAGGDCMPRPDPAVTRDEVLGKLLNIRRFGRPMAVPQFSLLHRVFAWLLCRSNLLRRAVLWAHFRSLRRAELQDTSSPTFEYQVAR